MAEQPEQEQPQAEGPKFKVAANPMPPEEIYVDGVAGILARPGVMKLDCYRVVRIDPDDNAEVRSITHRLVFPSSMVPEIMRLFQNMAERARQAREQAQTGGEGDRPDPEKLM